MPAYEVSPLLAVLEECPPEQLPIYAVLGVWHQNAARSPLGTCVIVAHQLAGALHHLGVPAQPVAATAAVYELLRGTGGQGWQVSDLGSGDTPPSVDGRGMTDGHMVLHVPDPGLIIDASIVQVHSILRRAYRDIIYSVPAIAPVPRGKVPDIGEIEFAYHEELRIRWKLQPSWTNLLDTVLDVDDLRSITHRGALVFAHQAVTLITALMEDDPSLNLSRSHPRVDALARQQQALPPID